MSLDSLTLVQVSGERNKKGSPVCSLLVSHPFVITKEQTHIKHTQGAGAAIAVSAVLLWVAGADNVSHPSIYIFLNHQLEAGHILEEGHFCPLFVLH